MPDFDPIERELHGHLGQPKAGEHPSLQLLLALDQGVLPADVEVRVQAHLESCRVCSSLIKDFDTLPEVPLSTTREQRIAGGLPSSQTLAASRSRSTAPSVWMGIAATLIFAAGAFLFFAKRHTGPSSETATAPTVTAPTQVSELVIPLTPLPPPADGVFTLQTRGSAGREPSVDLLLPAFDAYNHGDYATAEQRFTPLLARYPKSDTVALYLGVARLYVGHDSAAYEALTSALHNASPSTKIAAEWYTAIAAQRLGKPQAHALLTSICNAPSSPHQSESCRIAPTLAGPTSSQVH